MTTTQRGSAAALMLVLALGSSHANDIRRDRPFREGIMLASAQIALESTSEETSFNFAHLRDLWVRVMLAGATSPVQLNLRLIDPQGTLIYEASAVYASDALTSPVPGVT